MFFESKQQREKKTKHVHFLLIRKTLLHVLLKSSIHFYFCKFETLQLGHTSSEPVGFVCVCVGWEVGLVGLSFSLSRAQGRLHCAPRSAVPQHLLHPHPRHSADFKAPNEATVLGACPGEGRSRVLFPEQGCRAGTDGLPLLLCANLPAPSLHSCQGNRWGGTAQSTATAYSV